MDTLLFLIPVYRVCNYLVIWFARQSQYYILCIPEEKKKLWNFSFYNVFRQFWGLSLTIFQYH